MENSTSWSKEKKKKKYESREATKETRILWSLRHKYEQSSPTFLPGKVVTERALPFGKGLAGVRTCASNITCN